MPLDEDEVAIDLRVRAAAGLGVRPDDVTSVAIARRSLDARRGRPLGLRLALEVGLGLPIPVRPRSRPAVGAGRGQRVVIAGSGPAGTFAALWLAEAGAEVTVAELGKPVQARRKDLAALARGDALDPASNYCFGEGGAGTYSDGKLYTRVKDRDAVADVLEILVEHGADPGIRVEHRPHIGSNRLPEVLTGLRERLESLGVTYRFSDPLVDFVVDGGRVRGARLASGAELACDRLIIAVGHSARATYELCEARGVALVARPFAIGARVEHPQPLVDRLQYGAAWQHPRLPAAFYHVAETVPGGGRERGVYSFCMCPGGWIVDSSTEPARLATNGMSLKRRDSPYANAALVAQVDEADFAAYARVPGDPLAGMALQRAIEERAFTLGGGGFVAPAQRVEDFLARRGSSTVLASSYRPGVMAADLAEALPPAIVEAIRAALVRVERRMHGFAGSEAQLVGVETRTSAPVRIVRDSETLESPTHAGLYPCGEGAGYAGGIVSAAIDGLRVARRILAA